MKTDDYKYPTREREVKYVTQEIEICGHWISFHELLNLIEEFKDGGAFTFHDYEMQEALEKAEMITYAWEGGYRLNRKKIDAFYETVKRSFPK